MNKNIQVIYIEVDEELVAIVNRVKRSQKDEIALVAPKKSILFQSIVNLKILKAKLEEKGKHLTLITTDKKGRILA